MKRKVKLVIADIDDTLVNKNKQMMPLTKQMLIKLHNDGVLLGIASGRPCGEHLYSRYKGWELDFQFDVIIGMNGGQLWDGIDDRFDEYYPLKKEYIKEIIDLMSPLDLNPFIYRDDVMVASRMDEQMKASSERNSQDVHVAKDISELYETDISKIMFRMPESVMPEAEKLVVNIKDKPYRAFKTQTTMLEFMDARINKGNALVYFCNNNDIPLESVIAFGDMTNDNELLETAGLGVCLCNGNNETKKIANDITEYDNNHDGIGHYLMKHIIEPKGWDK